MKTVVDITDPTSLKDQNRFNHKYEIKLDFVVPRAPKESLVVVFGTHPSKDKKVLQTHRYRNCVTLNKELADRRCVSIDKSVIEIGDFTFTNISGNIYLFWAAYIRKENVNKFEVAVLKNTPILVQMDGYGAYGPYIFVFNDKMLVKTSLCMFHLDTSYTFYCLESDVKLNQRQQNITVLHEYESKTRVTNDYPSDALDEELEEDYDASEDASDSDQYNNNNL